MYDIMRRILRSLVLCALLTGCETAPKGEPPYKDQRSVTTRPASASGRKADVLVRVCELQGPPGPIIPFEGSAPKDAKLLVSAEILATFGTPFYCTIGLPEQRFELGGRVVRSDNGPCRIEVGYANHSRAGHIGSQTNVMLPIGETRVLMGCTNGLILTLVLEPVGNSPTTRP